MADKKPDDLFGYSVKIIEDEPEPEEELDFGIIPSGQIAFFAPPPSREPRSEVTADLRKTLVHLKEQVAELKEATRTGDEVSEEVKRLEAIAATIESAGEIGNKLSADVVLPPSKDLRVRLVPSDSLERLEEYRSDESMAFLLTGAFLGGVIGILSNWVTQNSFTFTRTSIVFMGFFGAVALVAGAWAWVLRRRAQRLKRRLLGSHDEGGSSTRPELVEDQET